MSRYAAPRRVRLTVQRAFGGGARGERSAGRMRRPFGGAARGERSAGRVRRAFGGGARGERSAGGRAGSVRRGGCGERSARGRAGSVRREGCGERSAGRVRRTFGEENAANVSWVTAHTSFCLLCCFQRGKDSTRESPDDSVARFATPGAAERAQGRPPSDACAVSSRGAVARVPRPWMWPPGAAGLKVAARCRGAGGGRPVPRGWRWPPECRGPGGGRPVPRGWRWPRGCGLRCVPPAIGSNRHSRAPHVCRPSDCEPPPRSRTPRRSN